MVGFYAHADSNKPIRTDLDNELVGKYITSHLGASPQSFSSQMLDGTTVKRFFMCSTTRKALDLLEQT